MSQRAQLVAGSSKQIMLTFSNKIRLDFVTSWVHHVCPLGRTPEPEPEPEPEPAPEPEPEPEARLCLP